MYFEVDYNDEFSFHNWMTDQSLYCYSSFEIGLLGSLFFLGFAISGILLKFSDIIGRKMVMQVGTLLQAVCCYLFYFTDNIYIIYGTLLLLGITWGKNM